MKTKKSRIREENYPQLDNSCLKDLPVSHHPLFGIHLRWPMLGLFVATILLGILAFISQLNLLFWSACLSTAIFFVSVILPGRIIKGIEIEKNIPSTGVASNPMIIKYTVRNTKRYLPIFSLKIAEIFDEDKVLVIPRVYVPYIKPGGWVRFHIYCTPTQRGKLTCHGTRIGTKYPFGLLTRFNTISKPFTATIYPALGKMKINIISSKRSSDFFAGAMQSMSKGTSNEFYALREYRPGDNPKLIHWKRSAQMGTLLVRQMTQFSPLRLTVILDTFTPEHTSRKEQSFEQAVSFTATLLCQALESGYKSALICNSNPAKIVPPLSGRDSQHRILQALSDVSQQGEIPIIDTIRTTKFTNAWRGRCIIIAPPETPSSVISKLTDIIGPVRVFTPDSPDWKRTFSAPPNLKTEVLQNAKTPIIL